MKKLLILSSLALFCAGTPTLASCDNHDEGTEVTIMKSDIVGTWMHNSPTDDDIVYITFGQDGKGVQWEVEKADPNKRPHDYEAFSYEIRGKYIYFTELDGEIDRERITLSRGGKLRIGDDNYERVKD